MYFSKTTIVSFGLLATSQLVAGHSAITAATGDAGGAGSAIGVDPATPRDGTRRNPFQQDATRFKGNAAATCGETLGGGDNDIEAGTKAVMAQNGATLPQVSAGGSLQMTVHQVNGDGAGPYTCMIDATGTGTNWTPMQVTTNIDGNARGRNNDQQMQDLPLNVAVAADQTCTGTVAGQSNVCMVRCENPARAGPFGGCVPVQMANAAAAPAAGGAAAGGAAGAGAAGTGAAGGAAAPAAGGAAGTGAAGTGAAGAGTAGTGAAGAGTAGTGAAGAGTAGTGAAGAGTAGTGAAAGGAAAPAAGGAAGTGAAGTAGTGAAGAGTAGAATGATGATGAGAAQGAGAATGATGATGAGAAAKRSPKTVDGVQLTDDDQEEEIIPGDEEFKRWVVNDN